VNTFMTIAQAMTTTSALLVFARGWVSARRRNAEGEREARVVGVLKLVWSRPDSTGRAHAHDALRELEGASVRQAARRLRRPASRSRSASGLTRIAARVLPASERDRYVQEYSAELHELAQTGVGRPRQVMYGIRVITRTVPLRFALRAPRRERAAP